MLDGSLTTFLFSKRQRSVLVPLQEVGCRGQKCPERLAGHCEARIAELTSQPSGPESCLAHGVKARGGNPSRGPDSWGPHALHPFPPQA